MFPKLRSFFLFLLVFMVSVTMVYSETPLNPVPDFPGGATTAKAGESVLTPNYKVQRRSTDSEEGIDKITFIYYNAVMEEPGEEYSKVKFTFDGIKEIPNYMIIPIPAGQTAKKGDVLLSWWQSGSGLKRAYVVDDSNPKEPIVRYLDIAYDNPAKRDGVSIGQMEEQLKPDTFVKISKEMEPGTSVATADERWGGYAYGNVLRVEGDKVLVMGHAGKIQIFDKDQCIPVPIIPDVKEGDEVQVPRAGKFLSGTVTKVDKEIGRVFVETRRGESVVAFGDVITGLELQ